MGINLNAHTALCGNNKVVGEQSTQLIYLQTLHRKTPLYKTLLPLPMTSKISGALLMTVLLMMDTMEMIMMMTCPSRSHLDELHLHQVKQSCSTNHIYLCSDSCIYRCTQNKEEHKHLMQKSYNQ